MNHPSPAQADLFKRVHDFVVAGEEGELTPDQWDCFERLLQESDEACRIYLQYVEASDLLYPILDQIADEKATFGFADAEGTAIPLASTAVPIVRSPWHELVADGWAVAYVTATVVLGIGMLVGGLTYVSQPQRIAKSPSVRNLSTDVPRGASVGRITGTVNCKWRESPAESRNVALGYKYELASGLLEITYDTGAKVILQGPVTYEVDSDDGGFLSQGKLTARVERHSSSPEPLAPSPSTDVASDEQSASEIHHSTFSVQHSCPGPSLFTIKTPNATVTDLGTEFGVEVDGQGSVEVHVIEGIVLTQFGGKSSVNAKSHELRAGEALRIESDGVTVADVLCRMSEFAVEMASAPNTPSVTGGYYARQVMADRPVAYYRLDETSGTIARNAGHRRAPHGTYMNFGLGNGPGNIGQAGPRPTDTIDGRPLLGFEPDNRAPYFEPSALTYVQVPETERGPLNIAGALSLEAWVCVEGFSDVNQGIVAKWCGQTTAVNTSEQRSYGLVVDNQSPGVPHSPTLNISGDGTESNMAFAGGDLAKPLPNGQWLHVVGTFVPGRSMRVYVNGALQASRTENVPLHVFHSAAPVWIGVQYASDLWSNLGIDGRIDEVAVYDYALDDVDGDGKVDALNRVTAHFDSAFVAPELPLAAPSKEPVISNP